MLSPGEDPSAVEELDFVGEQRLELQKQELELLELRRKLMSEEREAEREK